MGNKINAGSADLKKHIWFIMEDILKQKIILKF